MSGTPPTTKLKEFTQFSASQVNTFRDCQRKWFIEKIMGIKSPASQSQQFGTKVHEQVEHFIHGKVKAADMMAEAVQLIQYIPDKADYQLVPEPQIEVSGKGWAVPGIGYIDLAALDKSNPAHVKIFDWKTTKNFAYMPTVEEMWTNPQTVLYCGGMFQMEPGIQSADFTFAYTLKGYQPDSRKVSISLTRDDERFKESYEAVKVDVRTMKAIATLPSHEEVEPDLNSCNKYGGCPHRHLCPEHSKSNGLKGVDLMGIFDNQPSKPNVDAAVQQAQQQAQNLNNGINPPPNGGSNAGAAKSPLLSQPPQEPAQPVVTSMANPDKPKAAPKAETVPEAEEKPAKSKRKRRTKKEKRRDELIEQCNGDVTQLDDDEYEILSELIKDYPLNGLVMPPRGIGPIIEEQELNDTVPETAADPDFVPINQRVKQRVKHVTPEEVTAEPDKVAWTPVKDKDAWPEPIKTFKLSELRLFIGCKPNYPVKDLVTCLTPLFSKIEKDNNLFHWNQMEYGKGQTQVAALVNVVMLDSDPADREQLGLNGSVYYDGKDETLRQVVAVLKRHATLVVE